MRRDRSVWCGVRPVGMARAHNIETATWVAIWAASAAALWIAARTVAGAASVLPAIQVGTMRMV